MGGGALKQLTGSTNSTRSTMICPVEEQKRQDQLEAWYKEDGRDDESHPMHALYTGLAEKYMKKELDVEALFREYWEGSYPNAPANKQSAASHVAFAQFVLSKASEGDK
jgi:hypothetical protein